MTAPRVDNIIRAVMSEPWLILPGKLEAIIEFLKLRASGVRFTSDQIRARVGPDRQGSTAPSGSGVAVLPLVGIISQRMPMLSDISSGGGVSTEAFGRTFDQAVADPAVKSILLEIDSPGGTVHGVSELAQKIFSARGTKPIVAIANSMAASAAYWIASAADQVVVTPSGLVGSIGVYTVLEDISRQDEMLGVRKTVIRAGKFKAEGADGGPLSEEATAHLQQMVNEIYGMFVSDVARFRGYSTASVVNGFGQGRAVLSPNAVRERLVDRVAPFDETVRRLASSSRSRSAFGAHSTPRRFPSVEKKRLALTAEGVELRMRRADMERRKLALAAEGMDPILLAEAEVKERRRRYLEKLKQADLRAKCKRDWKV